MDRDLAAGYDGERLREVIRDNLWLHFTQMGSYRAPEHRPMVLVRGEGSTVWDAEGKGYLDLLAGIYSVNAGHGRRRIVEAMTAQLEALPFVNPFRLCQRARSRAGGPARRPGAARR